MFWYYYYDYYKPTFGSASAEDDGADGHSLRVLPPGVDDGALIGRAGETSVGVSGRSAWHSHSPGLVQPGGDGDALRQMGSFVSSSDGLIFLFFNS